MKFYTELALLGIVIFFFVVLIVWNFMNPNRKESFKDNLEEQDDANTETYEIDIDTSSRLGNYLSCYFYNMGLAFLRGKHFQTTLQKNDVFTSFLPKKVELDESIQQSLISVGITEESLQKELDKIDGNCHNAWNILTKERETFWNIMKPTVHRLLKKALEKKGLTQTIDVPVIHYRCSDVPIQRDLNASYYYHFQKYSFFKNALDIIQQKTGTKYKKVYISFCGAHLSSQENQKSCHTYVSSLQEYLESLGYEVIVKCNSVNDDFAMMFYAPALISTSSSFSFMAGYFSDGVFIGTMYDEKMDRQCDDCDDWLQNGYTLKHSMVADYHYTNKVISMLKK